MDITLLKGKLHMATVTQSELWYDGSCAIDTELLELAGLREFEKIGSIMSIMANVSPLMSFLPTQDLARFL